MITCIRLGLPYLPLFKKDEIFFTNFIFSGEARRISRWCHVNNNDLLHNLLRQDRDEVQTISYKWPGFLQQEQLSMKSNIQTSLYNQAHISFSLWNKYLENFVNSFSNFLKKKNTFTKVTLIIVFTQLFITILLSITITYAITYN